MMSPRKIMGYAVFVLLLMTYVLSQQQEQSTTLNKETIDAILQVVSPGCRTEMEAALEVQSDISDDCKKEIHSVLQSFSQSQSNSQDESAFDAASNENFQQKKKKKETPKTPPLVHPGISIAIFITLLFAGIAAYIVYVNNLLAKVYPARKEKKISKKKLEKMRSKGGRP